MGRPCEYDGEKALDRAMLVFWRKGFGGTSLSDLEEAMGMKRQSIYNAFGDKSELYSRCLARYRERSSEVVAPLRAPGANLSDLRDCIRAAFQLTEANDCGACMVVKTVFDLQVDDPEIAKVAAQVAKDTRKLYEQVIRNCQERGEMDPKSDAKALANYIYSVANGLSVLSQTGGSRSDVFGTLDVALAALTPTPTSRPRRNARKHHA